MAASTGLRQSSMLVSVSCSYRISWRSFSRRRPSPSSLMRSCRPIIMFRSMPEVKCLPSPRSTTARTSGVASAHCMLARMSCHICQFMALAFSGRLSVSVATWPSICVRMISNCMGCLAERLCLVGRQERGQPCAHLGAQGLQAAHRTDHHLEVHDLAILIEADHVDALELLVAHARAELQHH